MIRYNSVADKHRGIMRRWLRDEAARIEAAPHAAPSFDPADHTVAEVNAYLAEADEAERARVLDAEQAGKDRKSVRSPEDPAGS